MTAGWIYAVRADDVKLGCTTNEDVFEYMHKNYSRTYASWRAVQLLHVPDCRLAERNLRFLLRDHLPEGEDSHRHELVRCSDELIADAFFKIAFFFHDDPLRVAADMQRARDLDKRASKQAEADERKRQQDALQRDKQAAADQRKRQRDEEADARDQAKQAKQHQREERSRPAAADIDKVKEFLDVNVEQGEHRDFVRVCDLFADFTREFPQDNRNKKGLVEFDEALKKFMGARHFKVRHQQTNRSHGKVFMTFRRKV